MWPRGSTWLAAAELGSYRDDVSDPSESEELDEVAYGALAARRLQWDSLLWQVPVLGLTAQAFLFTIALDPDSTRFSRVVASLLSLTATLMSMQLMASDRRAEVTDAHWLGELEQRHSRTQVHGVAFRDRRNQMSPDVRFPVGWLLRFRSINVWMVGLALFGVAAIAVLIVTFAAPEWLAGPPDVP
jgi:hypothetical protein